MGFEGEERKACRKDIGHDIWHKYHSWYFKTVSNFTRLTACEIMYNSFEISWVVFMPNITTNHATTYTNYLLFCKIWSAKQHSCPIIKCSWQWPAWPLQQCSWSGLPSPDVFSSFLLYLLLVFKIPISLPVSTASTAPLISYSSCRDISWKCGLSKEPVISTD